MATRTNNRVCPFFEGKSITVLPGSLSPRTLDFPLLTTMRSKQLPDYAPQLKSAALFFLGATFLLTSLANLGITLVNRSKVKSLSDYSESTSDLEI